VIVGRSRAALATNSGPYYCRDGRRVGPDSPSLEKILSQNDEPHRRFASAYVPSWLQPPIFTGNGVVLGVFLRGFEGPNSEYAAVILATVIGSVVFFFTHQGKFNV
jgi:hypothetical protein